MNPADLPTTSSRRPFTLSGASPGWTRALFGTAIAFCALMACYWGAVVSMVQTWERSGTYAHGFVVFPVSIWLIWRQRAALVATPPRAFFPGLAILGLLSAIWLLGELTDIQTFREFAFVASVPILIWTLLGTRVAATIAFPLALMLFAWPFGEFLLPGLIDWTADFAVAALRITGVPVFREGNHFTIPSGNWSVVDACSGLRYLIASVYGGSVFAYLSYRSWKRRVVFLGVSVVVPLVANWLRAYLIVMIGHLSNNRLAVGVDHLIYGWLFFGVVITAVFYVGSRFSDQEHAPAESNPEPGITPKPRLAFKAVAFATLGAVCFVAIGPAAALVLEQRSARRAADVILTLPSAEVGWQVDARPFTDWVPPYRNAAASLQQSYRQNDERTGLYIAYFRNQAAGSKLLTYTNTSHVDYGENWTASDHRILNGTSGTDTFPVIERRLRSRTQNLLIWQWYWIGGTATVNVADAKLAQARARLKGLGDDSAIVVVYGEYADDPVPTRERLTRFLRDLRPAITHTLSDAAGH